MKELRLAYADMWTGFDYSVFPLEKILSKRFHIIHDDINPDIVICGPFGDDYLKYDCIRLQFLGEALSPDFNIYDYAIGFDRMEFGDRYLRMPLYAFDAEAIELAKLKHELPDDYYLGKGKFCNFVVSNADAMPEREQFFKLLNSKKRVDSAGKYLNNMPNGERCDNLISFRKPYKFTLAFENSIMDGYITEKIMYAFAAGTVPIYYGGNSVELEFNEKAFIDVSRFDSMEACVEYIMYLDEHPEEYLKIAKAPALLDDTNYEQALLDFVEHIYSNKGNYCRASKKTVYGRIYEDKKKDMYNRRARRWPWIKNE